MKTPVFIICVTLFLAITIPATYILKFSFLDLLLFFAGFGILFGVLSKLKQ